MNWKSGIFAGIYPNICRKRKVTISQVWTNCGCRVWQGYMEKLQNWIKVCQGKDKAAFLYIYNISQARTKGKKIVKVGEKTRNVTPIYGVKKRMRGLRICFFMSIYNFTYTARGWFNARYDSYSHWEIQLRTSAGSGGHPAGRYYLVDQSTEQTSPMMPAPSFPAQAFQIISCRLAAPRVE